MATRSIAHRSELRKSERTHAALLDVALQLANREGLKSLSISGLADAARMSKSGVFVRFGSHDNLLIEVLKLHHEMFTRQATGRILSESPGVDRLRTAFRRWADCVTGSGNLGRVHLKGAIELDCDNGPVKTILRGLVEAWQKSLKDFVVQAIDANEISADINVDQIIFQLYGIMFAIYHEDRFMGRDGAVAHGMMAFDALIAAHQYPAPLVANKTSKPCRLAA